MGLPNCDTLYTKPPKFTLFGIVQRKPPFEDSFPKGESLKFSKEREETKQTTNTHVTTAAFCRDTFCDKAREIAAQYMRRP